MPHVRMRDGNSLYVRVIGQGQPVMLLHGFGTSSVMWLPNVLPLAKQYRFILPDLRGFGRSHMLPFNGSDVLASFVNDIDDILDHFGLDKVALGGVSLGAYTSLQYNRLRGFDRVSKYLHIDQSPQARNGEGWRHGLFGHTQALEFHRFRNILTAAEQHGRQTAYWDLPASFRHDLRQLLADFFCYAASRPYQRWLVQALKHREWLMTRLFRVDNWHAYLDVMRAFVEQDYDMRDSLARIQVPMTIMVGMQSRMYPPAGQLAIRGEVPHARIVPFARSGHVPMVDEPLKFQRELTQFLAA